MMQAKYQPRQDLPGRYDFGLNAQQGERAAQLHRESVVFDFLSQHVGGVHIYAAYPEDLRAEFAAAMKRAGSGWESILAATYWPYEAALEGKSDLIEQWYRQSGLTCGTYFVPVYDQEDQQTRRNQDYLNRIVKLPWLRFALTAHDVRRAKAEQGVALFGHYQPILPIPRRLQSVDEAYARGLRSLMLTYNRMDHVGVGCTERVDAGLSNYGVDVVGRCNDLGIIVDTSHCGHMTTMDACKVSKRPVTANHTAAKAVTNVARAKNDDALKAIADTGGVIGVVTVPFFITREGQPTIKHMLDHIDYIADLVGWRHVALGTDFPLQSPVEVTMQLQGPALAHDLGFRAEDKVDSAARTLGFEDYRDLPNITRGLVQRGYSDEQIKGILGENALRVFADVCG